MKTTVTRSTMHEEIKFIIQHVITGRSSKMRYLKSWKTNVGVTLPYLRKLATSTNSSFTRQISLAAYLLNQIFKFWRYFNKLGRSWKTKKSRTNDELIQRHWTGVLQRKLRAWELTKNNYLGKGKTWKLLSCAVKIVSFIPPAIWKVWGVKTSSIFLEGQLYLHLTLREIKVEKSSEIIIPLNGQRVETVDFFAKLKDSISMFFKAIFSNIEHFFGSRQVSKTFVFIILSNFSSFRQYFSSYFSTVE